MGIAYKLNGRVFADNYIGKVTPNPKVQIIDFTCATTEIQKSGYLEIQFLPTFANYYNFSYSSSDTDVAVVDSTTGLVVAVSNGSVDITVSDSVSGITKVFTISVVKYVPLEDLTARMNFIQDKGVFVTDIVPQPGYWFKAKVAILAERSAAFFGSRKYNNSDEDSIIFERDNTGLNYHSMRAKMYGTKYTSSQVMALNTRYVVEVKPSGVSPDPSVGTFSSSSYTYNQAYALVIGGIGYSNNTTGYNRGGMDIFGIEIYDSNDVLKHRLIPQPDLTFLDEVTGVSYTATDQVQYGDD